MNFVFAFFGQEAEVHRTVESGQNLCRCAEVNGAKTKSLRCRLVKTAYKLKKSRDKETHLTRFKIRFCGCFK